MKKIIIILLLIVLITISVLFFPKKLTNKDKPVASVKTDQITIVAQKLDTPWGIVFLPDHNLLVTERAGRVRRIDTGSKLQDNPVLVLNKVKEIGEGGLLGITISPNFSSDNYVYLYYTYQENNDDTLNRVSRFIYQDGQLKEENVIVDKIPGSANHNGGRIKFGPDNLLYITTGDAQNPSQAQDINSLGGKILRVTSEGKPVSDNPFNNLVYTYGHRNPQGLAWDNQGRLWAAEHGRSGVLSGFDEINLIVKGQNYGWPIIQGDETRDNMQTPKLHSGSASTWAPSGMAFVGNSLFFGGLRGSSLYEATINGSVLTLNEHYKNQFGRIRDVVLGPDNYIYFSTSNRDGRGLPAAADDQIIKIIP